ncbi:MAG: hypothetical protein LBP27_05555 [Treponema sp.]|jgi:hypothetical protein|nr:hypothetical protein [Treponema sp.]
MVLVTGNTYIPERERVTLGYDLITESNAITSVSGILFDMSGTAMNKSNSDIRLALAIGKNMNIGGRQATFAYVAYQRGFSRNSQQLAGNAGVTGAV